MTSEKWIKLGLVAADPQYGTLQGKITEESFDPRDGVKADSLESQFKSAINHGDAFELFDPIIFSIARTEEGPAIGTIALAKDSDATIVSTIGDSIMVNSRNILLWSWIDETDEQWQQIVATTISGIDIARGGNLDLGDDIIKFPGS